MKIKTSELTGAALDWAVAKCWYGEEYDISIPLFNDGLIFAPSTNWAHGGPLIEREGIELNQPRTWLRDKWCATRIEGSSVSEEYGPTPLIAAMRCFVASRLGDEVEVPEELQ